jgi:chitodextrinase
VRIYNRALSQAEIQNDMNTPIGGTPPPDTTPPTVPSNLTATSASPTQINLSWTASTDNVGVTGYLLERCTGATCSNFVQVGTPATTTFNDTGLLGSTTYSYRVRATDASNNFSAYSNTALATTAPPTFTAPTNLTATPAGSTQINLSWTAAAETGGTIANYLIERCSGVGCSNFAQVGASATTTFNDTGLTGSTNYSYRVRATDTSNNLGPYSSAASSTTPANTPSAPTNLTAAAVGPVQINLSWTAATETGGTIANYLIERCTGATCSNFAQVGTSGMTTFNDTGLAGSTSYRYQVRAIDTTNVTGPNSNTTTATTAAPTFTAPSSLTATASGPAQINLSWTAATETGGTLTQYLIERCMGASCSNFAQVGTSATTTFNNTGLLGSTTYSYRVRATDASNNFSAYSNTALDTTAPPTFTAPSNLTATVAGSTQINLSWTAATETGGTISQYRIERCQGSGCSNFAQVATSTTATYNNTSLLAGAAYSYRVLAADAANNVSPYSNIASATTTSTPPLPITFVQSNFAVPQTPQTTVAVAYALVQTAGNLNVVVVGWNDSTATVSSVMDSSGNSYSPAIAPTVISGTLSQTVYYAKNIAGAGAGTNTVTVKFSTAAVYPDIRVLEYAGIDTTNPLDVSAAASGNSATSTSASVTTTYANDLIVGANMVYTHTSGPGAGFTKRVITSPDGDIDEDKVVAAISSYNATAPLTSSGPWIMQMVAFKGHP